MLPHEIEVNVLPSGSQLTWALAVNAKFPDQPGSTYAHTSEEEDDGTCVKIVFYPPELGQENMDHMIFTKPTIKLNHIKISGLRFNLLLSNIGMKPMLKKGKFVLSC